MSRHDEFTIDGRRILQAFNVGSHAVHHLENTLGGFWICTCGINECQHIQQVQPHSKPRQKRLAIALFLRAKRKLVRSKWLSKFITHH